MVLSHLIGELRYGPLGCMTSELILNPSHHLNLITFILTPNPTPTGP